MILWQAYVSFALLLFLLLSPLVRGVPFRSLLLTCCLFAGFIPVDGLGLAAYLRSFTDDLAITTLVALGWLTLRRLDRIKPANQGEHTRVWAMVSLMAVILYPATLGLTYVDPYRWGFNPHPMIVITGALALILFCTRQFLATVMLSGAALGFALRVKASENYWDYLIDPVIALFCCAALLVSATRALSHSKANPATLFPVFRLPRGRQ